MITNHNNFLKLAFNIAKINLGKTNLNPSVGCVVVKNQSVISSGFTSLNGRPHAEFNALNKKKNFKNSDLYVTLEPCTHYGKTPPCTKIIGKKGIKKVIYSFNDIDQRTAKKSKNELIKKKIIVHRKFNKKFVDFYKSYFYSKKQDLPYIDAKIAISKDFFSINKKSKWITNSLSRKRGHLIRSEYDAILTTSKTINTDNAQLNCRINGLNPNKPDLIIVDLDLKINKKIQILKKNNKRKIVIVTSVRKNSKYNYLKRKNVKFIRIKNLYNKDDFIALLKNLKKKNYSRILIETGLIFINELFKYKLIENLYVFQSSSKLKKNGKNNISNRFLRELKLKNRVKVNLGNDNLYKLKLANV